MYGRLVGWETVTIEQNIAFITSGNSLDLIGCGGLLCAEVTVPGYNGCAAHPSGKPGLRSSSIRGESAGLIGMKYFGQCLAFSSCE